MFAIVSMLKLLQTGSYVNLSQTKLESLEVLGQLELH